MNLSVDKLVPSDCFNQLEEISVGWRLLLVPSIFERELHEEHALPRDEPTNISKKRKLDSPLYEMKASPFLVPDPNIYQIIDMHLKNV